MTGDRLLPAVEILDGRGRVALRLLANPLTGACGDGYAVTKHINAACSKKKNWRHRWVDSFVEIAGVRAKQLIDGTPPTPLRRRAGQTATAS